MKELAELKTTNMRFISFLQNKGYNPNQLVKAYETHTNFQRIKTNNLETIFAGITVNMIATALQIPHNAVFASLNLIKLL